MKYKYEDKNISVWIIGIVLVVLVLLGIFIIGEGSLGKNSQTDNKQSLIQATETLYDFGTISMAKGNVTKLFKVTNPTDKDITIKTLTTSCMCTKAYIVNGGSEKGPFAMPGMGYVPPANEVMKAGESREIKVVYDPNAHGPAGVGPIDRFVYLTDSNGGSLKFEIKAQVTP